MALLLCRVRVLATISSSSYFSCAQLSSMATKLSRIRPEREEVTHNTVLPAEYTTAKPFNSIPVPRESWPVVGFLLELRKRKGKTGEENFFHCTTHQCGPIWRDKVFGMSIAVVNDPEAAEIIMRNEGKWPSRTPSLEDNMQWIHRKINVPDGLLFSSGANWKRLRTAMGKHVTPSRLRKFTSALYLVSNDLCNHLASMRNREGVVANILPSMQNWALHGVSRVVFDEDIDVHSGKDPTSREFVEAAIAFNESILLINGSTPLYKIYPTKPYRRYVRALQKMHAVGTKVLKKHFEDVNPDIKKGKLDEASAIGLLDQWLMERKLSEDEAVMQAVDMLTAGTDTTSNAATFLLYELAKNVQTQEAVRQEVIEVVGADEEPTHEKLQQLPLVRGCVREMLRLYPINNIISRVIPSDIVLMGYQIPAGTIAGSITSLPGFDPYHFPNPECFDPHRWCKGAQEIQPFASLPFGFGPRGCYGRRIAEMELHLLVVCVLQRFQLSTTQSRLALRHTGILRPAEPVMLQFTDKDK